MQYYSTNKKAPMADLHKAVVKGLAEDRGLYMPETIHKLPKEFFDNIQDMSFQDIAYNVASAFFGEDVDQDALQEIVFDTLRFDCPVVKVCDNIYALELFHGPTLAFKDVGARFMARLLQWSLSSLPSPTGGTEGGSSVNVLVATSGDTGSAVANGFLGVEGIHVYVLYPKGKVSPIQECQFTTLGQNITAVEVDGVFDDCQALVKSAFMDADLKAHMRLTSANSINVARFLPQAFYYFWAYAQLRKMENGKWKMDNDHNQPSIVHSPLSILHSPLVICVPSGNFGNICSALFGHVMGLPVKRFIAANNANSVFYEYLQSGDYRPRPSVQTIANAMDVGDPSNFARILDLYSREDVLKALTERGIAQPLPSLTGGVGGGSSFLSGATYTDEQIAATMRDCYARTGYILDPHGACGYRALKEQLLPGEVGIFLETAHPAKFKDTVDRILGIDLPIPEKLQAFMRGQKQSIAMPKDFDSFKRFLMKQ